MKILGKRLRETGIVIAWVAAIGLSADGAAGQEALFRYQDRTYTSVDAPPKLRALLYRLDAEYFQTRRELVDEMLLHFYLTEQAKRRGVTKKALAAELLASPAPDEDALRMFYRANEQEIRQPYEQVKDRIRSHLVDQQLRAKKAELVAELKRHGQFALLIDEPPSPPLDIATDGHPSRGAESPRITIVEFADYQCPRCRRAAQVLERMVETYPGDVRVVFMDFPINRSGISRKVAEGAVCAQAQGRFWEYHDLAFANQSRLDHDSVVALATKLELDTQAFESCLNGPGPKTRVARSEGEARRLGLRATPSIFVNGRPLVSNHLERDLVRLIEKARTPEGG